MGGKISNEEKQAMRLLELTGMSKKEIKTAFKDFKKSYPSGRIKKEEFKNLIQSENLLLFDTNYIDHIFNIFDVDGSGDIDFFEFQLTLFMCRSKNPSNSIRFCVKCLDVNGSGKLEKEELIPAFERIFKNFPQLMTYLPEEMNTPTKVVDKLFDEIDKDGDGSISADDLIDFAENRDKYEYYGLHLIFGPL